MTIVSATFFCLTGTIGFYATYIVRACCCVVVLPGCARRPGGACCSPLSPAPLPPAPCLLQFIRKIYSEVKCD